LIFIEDISDSIILYLMTSTFPPLAQAVAGSLGAAISNVGVYPFDLVTTRIQAADHTDDKERRNGMCCHTSTLVLLK